MDGRGTSARTAQILTGIEGGSPLAADLAGRLVAACSDAVDVTGVGLVLMTDAGPAGTVAATDGPAARMEELQFSLGEGPCVDASRSGHPVLQPDLGATGPSRWPGFAAGALEAGIRAVFALPLSVGGVRVGVLDLYRDTAGVLPRAELAEALSFADAATAVLLGLQELAPAELAATGGGEPAAVPVVEDRAEVHQASGMVAVQAGVDLAQGLALLRARAYAGERSILAVSRDVVARSLSFVPGDHGADMGSADPDPDSGSGSDADRGTGRDGAAG